MKNKKGRSLFILIALVVIITLASTIIIILNNNLISNNQNEKVDTSDINKKVNRVWSKARAEGISDKKILQAIVKASLREAGIDENIYEINITENGVDLQKSTTSIYFGKPYSVNQDGVIITLVVYKDGSAGTYINKYVYELMPAGTIVYEGNKAYVDNTLLFSASENGTRLECLELTFELDDSWCIHNDVTIINMTNTYYGDVYCYECGEILEKLEHNNIIPEGGIYYVGVTSTTLGDYSGATSTYTAGQQFPSVVNAGDIYVYDNYEYRYNIIADSYWLSQINNETKYEQGWFVRTLAYTRGNYGCILANINGKDVVNMFGTFWGCENLLDASNIMIPNSIKNMSYAFVNCNSLEKLPKIPASVNQMYFTFSNCNSLKDVSSLELSKKVTSLQQLFCYCNNLKTVKISKNIKNIKNGSFWGCTSLTTIIYEGTIQEWKKIIFEPNWDNDTGDYTIYCTNGRVAKDGTVTYN